MAIDYLPEEMLVLDRAEMLRRWLRDYSLRNPDADVSPNSLPYQDGVVVVDQMMVLMNNARLSGNANSIRGMKGQRLNDEAVSLGRPRKPAIGGSGFVAADTAAAGSTIFEGDVITDETTRLVFEVAVTKLYLDGEAVPVRGIDTGADTNLPAGSKMLWANPRPGCGPSALVVEQFDGTGLSGGHAEETDEELQDALIYKKSHPDEAGNDAAVQAAVEDMKTIAVRKCFTVPAAKASGTTAVGYLLRRDSPSGARIPNDAQDTEVQGQLDSAMCGDDGCIVCETLPDPTPVALRVEWMRSAAGWTDLVQFPEYVDADPVHVTNAVAIGAAGFRVTTSGTAHAPQIGQTVAVFDAESATFKRKRILTVTQIVANKTWDLTFDLTLQQSDPTFIPANGALVSPWSDSLDGVALSAWQHFETFGLGEQVEVFPDPGRRQRRSPFAPDEWPNVLTNRVAYDVVRNTATVASADLLSPAPPHATTTGMLGVRFYLMTLSDLGVYA